MNAITTLKLPTIEQVNTDAGRYYVTPEGNFTSFSSIYAATQPESEKVGLNIWKQRVGEAEAERIKEAACVRGTAVHSAIEHRLNGSPLIRCAPQYRGYFRSMEPHLADIHNPMCEVALYFFDKETGMGFAGTADCMDISDQYIELIDFKTSDKKKSSTRKWKVQLGAYALMIEYCLKKPVLSARILCGIPNQEAQIVHLNREKVVEFQKVWLTDYLVPYYVDVLGLVA